ncbi:NAD-dependent epimerase/dehydratase family protein [Candidatus Micrarchaeota archaeon]|nr:NAD-dependent epimerase/dehydratase family protein [Candidatus Micrarchaeota archaeon]
MATRKIYLTGANGRIGGAVLRLLPDAIPLVRKRSGMKNERVVDFFDAEGLKKALRDADVVVHMAGSVRTYDKNELWKSNYELTKRIVEAMPEKARIVFASSISVYGKKPAALPADENTPVNPDSEYARSKYESEKLVAAHPDHVILRLGTVYGPEFMDYFYVLGLLEKGKMRIIGDGSNRVPFVHVEDAAKAVAAAVSGGNGVYVIAGECGTQKSIYENACRELGVEAPRRHVPQWLADFTAMMGEMKAKISGKAPKMTREHVAILGNDRCFNCNKARRELGFYPRSIVDGIKEMAEIYGKRERLST